MKKFTLMLTGTICCILSTINVHAQRSYIRRAIERKYEQKNEKEHGAPGKAKANKWIDNLNDVQLRKEYRLTQSITFVTVKYKRGKPDPNNGDTLKTYVNPTDKLVGMSGKNKKEDAYIVIDAVSHAELMFNRTKKEMFTMNGNAFLSKKTQKDIDAQQEGGGEQMKPMNQTRKILGYTCNGYERYDKKGIKTDEFWVARLTDFAGIDALNPALSNTMGTVLETTHFRKDEPVQTMTAVALSQNEKLAFRTADYERKGISHME